MTVAILLPLAGSVYCYGVFMDCEFIHWPTIWQASRAKAPSGVRVSELILTRATSPSVQLDSHHCGWCKTVYAYAKHTAIKVSVSSEEAYLFDWDGSTRRLTPLTVRTAAVFPELVPADSVVEPLSDHGLDGQFHTDRPCRIIPRTRTVAETIPSKLSKILQEKV